MSRDGSPFPTRVSGCTVVSPQSSCFGTGQARQMAMLTPPVRVTQYVLERNVVLTWANEAFGAMRAFEGQTGPTR
jgi:hypothetical protein